MANTQRQRVLVDIEPRCRAVNALNGQRCNRMLAWQVARPWRIACSKCGTTTEMPVEGLGIDDEMKQAV